MYTANSTHKHTDLASDRKRSNAVIFKLWTMNQRGTWRIQHLRNIYQHLTFLLLLITACMFKIHTHLKFMLYAQHCWSIQVC